jgi:hypothetical protein
MIQCTSATRAAALLISPTRFSNPNRERQTAFAPKAIKQQRPHRAIAANNSCLKFFEQIHPAVRD